MWIKLTWLEDHVESSPLLYLVKCVLPVSGNKSLIAKKKHGAALEWIRKLSIQAGHINVNTSHK